MSEPVGNGPRSKKLESISGNSHKDRETTPSPEEEKEEVVKVVTGKVVVKKKSVLQRFTSKMIAEDAKNVGDYILDDILLPAVKNLILDVINSGSSRMLLGSGGRRHGIHPQQSGGSGIRTKYSNIPVDNRARGHVARERHDLETIAVEDRQQAYAIIDALIDRCNRYRVATVKDFYDMCGVTGDYTALNWGWDNLQSADVRMRGGMYYFDLPDPQPIRR